MADPAVVQLLTEIKNAIEGTAGSKYLIAIIAASSGILGASIPTIIQFFANRRLAENEKERLILQIKADVITRQRQTWIDSIRNTAKDLIAEFNKVYNLADGSAKAITKEEFDKLHFEVRQKMAYIELHLNPNKPEQKAIVDAMNSVNNALHRYAINRSEEHDAQYSQAMDKLASSLIVVFGLTWKKIKNLE